MKSYNGSVVETVKANELNVYAYLDYLLEKLPNADLYNHPEIIDDMLPWTNKLPESCQITNKHKKIQKIDYCYHNRICIACQ